MSLYIQNGEHVRSLIKNQSGRRVSEMSTWGHRVVIGAFSEEPDWLVRDPLSAVRSRCQRAVCVWYSAEEELVPSSRLEVCSTTADIFVFFLNKIIIIKKLQFYKPRTCATGYNITLLWSCWRSKVRPNRGAFPASDRTKRRSHRASKGTIQGKKVEKPRRGDAAFYLRWRLQIKDREPRARGYVWTCAEEAKTRWRQR